MPTKRARTKAELPGATGRRSGTASGNGAAPLPASRYAALLEDARELLRSAEKVKTTERVHTYWRLGRRIARERLARNAGYHNVVLRDLAADLRLAVRTLQRVVLFYEVYPELPPASSRLTWLHYLALLKADTPEERAFYEALAVEQSLSARQLDAAIRAGVKRDPDAATRLERPTTPSYLYAASLNQIVDGDTLVLDIDLGFRVFRRERIRLAGVDAPEIDTAAGRQARDFVAARLLPARSLAVQTRRFDRYARYVAHVFHSRRELGIDDCFARGHYLNDELLREGHARRA